ncbi:MAG: FAD binding domain-containing protein [Ignavibacteriales bacterium]|nr:FAD binding domain-containing protein [Ignavibacteriales bacterium]
MIPKFNFVRPNNLNEILEILHQQKDRAKILAGGTDIIPGFQIESKRFTDINLIVDINRIDELKTVEKVHDKIRIGSAVTFSEINNNKLLQDKFPLLTKATLTIGSLQIRNRATIAGNFVNNAPCADSVPPLLVYNAIVKIQSLLSVREISLQEFLVSPYKTQLKPDEVVTEILLPIPADNFNGDFYKLGRRRGVAISRITLALLCKTNNSIIDEIRIASGAITPIGKRFYELEKFAQGKSTDSDFFKTLSIELGRKILEESGSRWSSPYKLPVVQQMFYQLLERVCR